MKVDLSFWRFVIFFNIAKTGLWRKGSDVFILHLGSFSNESNTAIRIVVFPFSLIIGFITKGSDV
ncbi:hypothetical protein [Alteromonas sp. BMJM2]|uniref:hypothetical protein n=1 Tax=Alteromonas sp. BMJM2 TaxID=2954241 RepID=UPI0022B54FB5|nr:hypothetical protein [Alteromonas sp. BMJM2]